MFAIVGILILTTIIALIEVPPLIKNKAKKDLGVFLFLLLFGLGLSIAEVLRWDIPNPLDGISFVFKPISDWMEQVLK